MTTDPLDKFVKDGRGVIVADFVDSFTIAELVFPGASVIGCRLYESGEESGPIHQIRMSSRTARALAESLLECADEIDGVGHPRQ